jgi:hypothetical protein
VYNASLGSAVLGLTNNNDYRKSTWPDVVANLRIDQAWGSLQGMIAIRDVSAGYYGTTLTGAQGNGYPSDKIGWAAGVGAKINTPFISPGDYFMAQYVYSVGAVRYVANTPGSSGQAHFQGGTQLGYGYFVDAVTCGSSATGVVGCPAGFTAPSGLELTTAWGVAAAYEHFWTPSLRTSIHGDYVRVQYSATANSILCAQTAATANSIVYTTLAAGLSGTAACDNNWSKWQLGSRTQWNVTKDFYMGFDIVHQRLRSAGSGNVVFYTALAGGAQPSGVRTLGEQSIWAGRVRWHRDIVP